MTNANMKLPVVGDLGPDATEAAWRLAGAQFVKLAREPLAAALARNLGPGDEALRGRIAAFLQTELGTALLTALLSAGLSALPQLPLPGGREAPQRLARELRVKAMADAGDVAADLVMGPLRETLAMMVLGAGAAPETPASLGAREQCPAVVWGASVPAAT